jgi:hypothetical protein
MINISVTIPPPLFRLEDDFTRHALKGFDAGVIGLVGDVRRRSPIDTGDLRDGFYGVGARVVSGEFTAALANDVTASLYRVRGRGPGKPPPITAITPWANRRGISPYLVARSIGRRGTARWRDNENVLDIERTSQPGNEIPKRDGVLIKAANAIARNVNEFNR